MGVTSKQYSSELAAVITMKTDTTPSTRPTSAPVWSARYCTISSASGTDSISSVALVLIIFADSIVIAEPTACGLARVAAYTAPNRKINQYTPISTTAAASGTPITSGRFGSAAMRLYLDRRGRFSDRDSQFLSRRLRLSRPRPLAV